MPDEAPGKPSEVGQFERDVVARYSQRLVQIAGRELPGRLRGRLDPEDVIQSVYRSFFGRLKAGEFRFEDSHDIWRLLTVMTYRKVQNAIKHHQRGRRDVRRELVRAASEHDLPTPEKAPGPEDVAALYDCLERLLKGLPEKYARIITLRLQGEAIAEIARKVAYSQRTVLRVLGNVQQEALKQLEPQA